MGIEYYIVKPEKKEVFYMAKHFQCPRGMSNAAYRSSIAEATYIDYEDWEEFFWDTLKTNWNYFLNCDLKMDHLSEVIYQLYKWCSTDKVILDNDCSTTSEVWKDWKETGNITSILEGIHKRERSAHE